MKKSEFMNMENLIEQKRDRDQDGQYETITRYKGGQPVEQIQDSNKDGQYDVVVRFKNGKPLDEERDTNFDGKKDVFIHYDERGNPEKIEEDTRHKGKIDRIKIFHNGELTKVIFDGDDDGFMETEVLYKGGKPVMQTEDRNRDKKARCVDLLQ